MAKKMTPEDNLMAAIFGKPINEMNEDEKSEALQKSTKQKTKERDIMFNNTLDIITELTSGDTTFLCEIVCENEGEWCEKYCCGTGNEIPRLCLVKALKYYKKESLPMKIDGRYEQKHTEKLLTEINGEDSITKRRHLISKYLYQRIRQVEKVLTNIEDDDIDFTMVIEQMWDDLQLAHEQLRATAIRSDFYAKYYKLNVD